jgi:hypothetical protein
MVRFLWVPNQPSLLFWQITQPMPVPVFHRMSKYKKYIFLIEKIGILLKRISDILFDTFASIKLFSRWIC